MNKEIWKGLLIMSLLILSVACQCHRPPVPTLEETMLAFLEDMPQDQGQWNQYQMELNEQQYQYQREEAARQAQEYQELLESHQPENCRQGGSYGHEGEPLFQEP